MKQFTYMPTCEGEFKVHKAGCAHIKREILNTASEFFHIEAENVEAAIELVKQELFEDAGGQGDRKQADQEEWQDALLFADQVFNIVSCARS